MEYDKRSGPLALGIDTGGTFTDAVLVEQQTGRVLASAKALTTPHDLSLGIAEAMRKVFATPCQAGAPLLPQDVALVGLSTTLATNAMAEGQAGSVCLLLIGYDAQLITGWGFDRELGTADYVHIRGGHNEMGDETAPLDEVALRDAIVERRDSVEAFAISGYFSVRNSAHEERARALVEELAGRPATCGHELSSRLNAIRRATTATLNARLIPPIRDLISAVSRTQAELGVAAPLMVVRGDGSLVRADWAATRPVETILSGPAASVVGAWHLAGRSDAWIVDMGGTTTDIASLSGGVPILNTEGANVAGWRTMVQAIDVYTTGLGGDSHVRWQDEGHIAIGPRRVIPLCLLAEQYPSILGELSRQIAHKERLVLQRIEFVVPGRPPASRLDDADRELLDRIGWGGPQLITALIGAQRTGRAMRSRIEDLISRGLLRRSAFTPTDALHALGRLELWNAPAARLGAELAAAGSGMEPQAFCGEVVAGVVDRVATSLLSKGLEDETGQPCSWEQDELAARLLRRALRTGSGRQGSATENVGCALSLTKPVVAIGAPVEAYLPEVAKALNAELVIPAHAEVANAVGAVAGGVIQRHQVLISPLAGQNGNVRLFLPEGNHDFSSLDDAVVYARQRMVPYAEAMALRAGAGEVEIQVEREDHWARTRGGLGGKSDKILIGSDLTFVAVGRPTSARSHSVQEED